MIVSILTEKKSWIRPFVEQIREKLNREHAVQVFYDHNDVIRGGCLVILGYEKIIPQSILDRNKHNLVVHESDLPSGKGWSPLTWQIIEGKNRVPIVLFGANADVDSGDIYLKDEIVFEGHELIGELREKQGKKTVELVCRFFKDYPDNVRKKQEGSESFYPRRGPRDSELPIDVPLKDLFNRLRVVDNDRYPAFFSNKGKKYLLKIYKEEA
ncbi:MAG: formyltransferase family protein [Candidatus Margulisiibacteriota bacterium]|nr:formyltransferase family protein [Candidatus Margulisiibacteriota bacterium]